MRVDPRSFAATRCRAWRARTDIESSVRLVPHGAGSSYLHERVHLGDIVAAAAPRGSFLLRDGQRPVVLLSAGVGATPVLAMLQALVNRQDHREI